MSSGPPDKPWIPPLKWGELKKVVSEENSTATIEPLSTLTSPSSSSAIAITPIDSSDVVLTPDYSMVSVPPGLGLLNESVNKFNTKLPSSISSDALKTQGRIDRDYDINSGYMTDRGPRESEEQKLSACSTPLSSTNSSNSKSTPYFFGKTSKSDKIKEKRKDKQKERTIPHSESSGSKAKHSQSLHKISLEKDIVKAKFSRELEELDIQSFSEDVDLNVEKFNGFICSLCRDYDFFKFIFISEAFRKTGVNPSWFNWTIDESKGWSKLDQIEDRSLIFQLYEHLTRLFLTNEMIDNLSMQALLCIVLNAADDSRKKGNEEELDSLYRLLLYTQAGRRILYSLTEDSVKHWAELLGKEQMNVFFQRMVSSIDVLENGNKVKKRQFNRVEAVVSYIDLLLKSNLIKYFHIHSSYENKIIFLENIRALDSPILDMQICENRMLMQIAREKGLVEELVRSIKRYFSFEFFFSSSENQRAADSNEPLIEEGQEKIGLFDQCLVLSLTQAEKIVGTQLGMELNRCKMKWMIFYKELLALSVQHWYPHAKELPYILDIKQKWYDAMIKPLTCPDQSTYDPQRYTLDKLPGKLQRIFKLRKELYERYCDQIEGMDIWYKAMTQCRTKFNDRNSQSCLKVDGYKTSIELIEEIKELIADRLSQEKPEKIQWCTEEITRLIVEAAIGPSWSKKSNPILDIESDIFYIRTDFYKECVRLLQETKTITISGVFSSRLFSSTNIFLDNKHAKKAVRKVLDRMPIRQEDIHLQRVFLH